MAENAPKKKRNNMFTQIKQIYDFTKQDDPQVTWWVAGAFLIPFVVVILIGFLLKIGWIMWIFTVILAVMLGFLCATIVLTRRSETVGYRRLEGQPGAAGAVLDSLSKRVFTFQKEPVWVDPHTKNAVWRGTSLYGVFLVAEGPANQMSKVLDREEEKIRRVTRGSEIPMFRIYVGNGEGQIPLSKLSREMRRRRKIRFTSDELDHVNDRLRTLQAKNGMGIPKGIDPNRMHGVSRRAMRGK